MTHKPVTHKPENIFTPFASFPVPPSLNGARADRAAADLLPHLSRSKAKSLIEEHGFYYNGSLSFDAGLRLKNGDNLSFPPALSEEAPPAKLEGNPIKLSFLYEDEEKNSTTGKKGKQVHQRK